MFVRKKFCSVPLRCCRCRFNAFRLHSSSPKKKVYYWEFVVGRSAILILISIAFIIFARARPDSHFFPEKKRNCFLRKDGEDKRSEVKLSEMKWRFFMNWKCLCVGGPMLVSLSEIETLTWAFTYYMSHSFMNHELGKLSFNFGVKSSSL